MTATDWEPDEVPPPPDDHAYLQDTNYEAAEQEQDATAFAMDVAKATHRLRVTEAARQTLEREHATDAPPLDVALLGDILARPTEPPHRVADLIPSAAGTLLTAMRKTGKTTITLNLARSLITGEPFLDRFDVRKIDGTVAFMNYEVSAAQLARWAHEVDVDPKRFLQVNLRGRRNPLTHDDDLAALSTIMRTHEVESLIVDPFGRAYTGENQNDAGEVGAWLSRLDTFARSDAGVADLVLTAHAGWNGERTRGSSALEDWADSIITLTRAKDDDSLRFFKATGRDVDIDEDELAFDHDTRHLSLTGAGSRRSVADSKEAAGWVDEVVVFVTEHPGVSKQQIEKAFKVRPATIRKATDLAVDKGLIDRVKTGQRQSHFPATRPGTTRPNSSQTQTPESQPKTELVPTRPDPSQVDPHYSSHSSIGTSGDGRVQPDEHNTCTSCQKPLLLNNGRTTCERCRLNSKEAS